MALTPADVDLERGRVKLPDRRKGKGVAGLWHGRFSLSSVRKSLKTAARKIGLTRTVRVYDFRHSYGTQVYSATQNLAATGKLLQQRSAKTTERSVMEADAQVVSAVTALVGAKLADS